LKPSARPSSWRRKTKGPGTANGWPSTRPTSPTSRDNGWRSIARRLPPPGPLLSQRRSQPVFHVVGLFGPVHRGLVRVRFCDYEQLRASGADSRGALAVRVGDDRVTATGAVELEGLPVVVRPGSATASPADRVQANRQGRRDAKHRADEPAVRRQ